jgi:glutathione S-transferase
MAAKWVRSLPDLRKIGSENDDTWAARVQVACEVLQFIAEDGNGARLYQQKGVRVGEDRHRIPDFLVKHPDGRVDAIEVGRVKAGRIEDLETAGYRVLRVRRNTSWKYPPPQPRRRRRRAAISK